MRSKTPLGVLQEWSGVQLAHDAVRCLMATSAAPVDLDPDRLSFTHAIAVLRDALPLVSLVPPPTRPVLFRHVLAEWRLPATLLPPRRLRCNPRVLKRSQTRLRRKRPPDQGFHLTHRSFADRLLL